ncbi:MAG: biopolymer transporter ExbD, partial [Halieaceae bacterium]
MSMRDQARPSADEGANQIDLTPMLDVVFIMLIFFIVTSSFVKEPGVELFKPQASTQEACERGTIIFAVDANGDIFYNKNKLPMDRVMRTAEAAKKEAPQANIVVQVDRE